SPSSSSPLILTLLIFELFNNLTILLANTPIPAKNIKKAGTAHQSKASFVSQEEGLMRSIKLNLNNMNVLATHSTKDSAIKRISQSLILVIRLNRESGMADGFT